MRNTLAWLKLDAFAKVKGYVVWVELVVDILTYLLVLACCQVVTVTFFNLGARKQQLAKMNLLASLCTLCSYPILTKFEAF